jgi:DIX domain
MGAVTVLYEESDDTSSSKNAFELRTSSDQITLQDLASAFPLKGSFCFSVKTLSGSYVDVVNPASRLDVIDGVISARVVPLSRLPLVSLTAATAEAIRCSRLPDQSHKHSKSSRGSSSGSGSWQQQQQQQSDSQQQSWAAELSKRRRSVESLGDNLQQQTSKVSYTFSQIVPLAAV